MTFAAPLFVWAAVAAAVVTVALHLLAWRRPPATPLPTARFAPDVPVRTVSRALRLSDLTLLALRVALLLLIGAALGRPRIVSRTAGVGRVIVVDQSGGPRVSAATADSARAHVRLGDVLVVFDSTAREVPAASRDSIGAPDEPKVTGSISAGLVAAIRTARRLERERDSVEIVIVSPFDAVELDEATATVRQQWHGLVRPVRVVVQPNDSSAAGRIVVRAPPGDAVAAALALSSPARSGGDVRVVRDALTASDSAWAQQGHTVVAWPSALESNGWPSRARPDTAFAVSAVGATRSGSSVAASATIVAALRRATAPPEGRVAARWQDGEPAATEHAFGAGCIRSVAVALPAAGDLVLTPGFRRFAERLTATCGDAGAPAAVSDSVVAAVLPAAIPTRTATTSVADVDAQASRLTAWLLALAIVAAVAELALRRGATNATA